MSYSSQVTSHLPIQKGAIFTLCWGASSSPRSASPSGLPITYSTLGMGTISNETSTPAKASVYFFISAWVVASAAGLEIAAGPVAAGGSADSTGHSPQQAQTVSARTHTHVPACAV